MHTYKNKKEQMPIKNNCSPKIPLFVAYNPLSYLHHTKYNYTEEVLHEYSATIRTTNSTAKKR